MNSEKKSMQSSTKSPKKRLKELEVLIELWENIVKDYLMYFTYKQTLRELKADRNKQQPR